MEDAGWFAPIMKLRKYFNLNMRGEAVATVGYPLSLPDLPGIEFAIVRPMSWSEQILPVWQVIHVRSGLRVMYTRSHEETRERAKAAAMAELERAGKSKGWKAVVRKLKRAKTPCIVTALESMK